MSGESGGFRREIRFKAGYNHLHMGGQRRGQQHGMEIIFLLFGDLGVTDFVLGTSWTPLGPVDEDAPGREPVHIEPDNWRTGAILNYKHGLVSPPTGFDLGYHWLTPTYAGEEMYADDECPFLPEGSMCHRDGSAAQADEVLRDFLAEGDEAVWRWLERRYEWCRELSEKVIKEKGHRY